MDDLDRRAIPGLVTDQVASIDYQVFLLQVAVTLLVVNGPTVILSRIILESDPF